MIKTSSHLLVAAVLSLGDLATDLIVLKRFFDGGDEMKTYRDASLACLTTSIVLQMRVVVFQNRKKRVLRIFKEMLIVVSGMKAAVDAYKVASGAGQEKDTEFDPVTEMTCSKCIEMFAESIPGIIIQTGAIISELNSGDLPSRMAYISLLFSTLTTGESQQGRSPARRFAPRWECDDYGRKWGSMRSEATSFAISTTSTRAAAVIEATARSNVTSFLLLLLCSLAHILRENKKYIVASLRSSFRNLHH